MPECTENYKHGMDPGEFETLPQKKNTRLGACRLVNS